MLQILSPHTHRSTTTMVSPVLHILAFALFATVCVAQPAKPTPNLQGRWYLITEADTDGNTGGDCQTVDYDLIAKLDATKSVYNVTRSFQAPNGGKVTSFSFVQTFDGLAFTSPGNRPGAIIFEWTNFIVLFDIPGGVPGALSRWPSSTGHLKKALQINRVLDFPPSVVKQGFRRCTYAPGPKKTKCY